MNVLFVTLQCTIKRKIYSVQADFQGLQLNFLLLQRTSWSSMDPRGPGKYLSNGLSTMLAQQYPRLTHRARSCCDSFGFSSTTTGEG